MKTALFIICFAVALVFYYVSYNLGKNDERDLKFLRAITFGKAKEESYENPDAFIGRYKGDFFCFAQVWAFASIGAYTTIALMIFCIAIFITLFVIEICTKSKWVKWKIIFE